MTGPAKLAIGVVATLAMTALYHGPLGAGARFAERTETLAARELELQEMSQVQAQLERAPLTRTLVLSGPADDFQREGLQRILSGLPGVASVRWDPASLPVEQAPR